MATATLPGEAQDNAGSPQGTGHPGRCWPRAGVGRLRLPSPRGGGEGARAHSEQGTGRTHSPWLSCAAELALSGHLLSPVPAERWGRGLSLGGCVQSSSLSPRDSTQRTRDGHPYLTGEAQRQEVTLRCPERPGREAVELEFRSRQPDPTEAWDGGQLPARNHPHPHSHAPPARPCSH